MANNESTNQPTNQNVHKMEDDPDSITQHLDMVENGEPRGDELLYQKGKAFDQKRDSSEDEEMDENGMMVNYHLDMADTNREGDEESGDEHSSGLQGGDSELESQPSVNESLPGDETRRVEKREKREAA